MSLLVDTSVWSLALLRDTDQSEPEVAVLKDALLGPIRCSVRDLSCRSCCKDWRGRRRGTTSSNVFRPWLV